MTSEATSVARRCATHPGRRAADACPVCDRPRCGADVASYGAGGCVACAQPVTASPAASGHELGVRAGLAAFGCTLVGGWIAAQYVDTQYFSLIAPALVGLVAGWAAGAAAPGLPGRWATGVAAVAGVVATGLSDRLVPGGQNLFLPYGDRLPPYVAAVAGALLWPLLFGPPRAGRSPQRGTRRK